MTDLPEHLLHEGLSVDIEFAGPGPAFGDVFRIVGETHPGFPAGLDWGFERLAGLGFEQVDDFFGLRSPGDEGDDVIVWLYPLVCGEPAWHHPGPFDGLRLSYCVLRHPARRAEAFLRSIESFAALGDRTVYRDREMDLGSPPDLGPLRADIEAVVRHWAEEGITVGSGEAMEIDL